MSSAEYAEPRFTAFAGDRLIARGDLATVARATHAHADAQPIVFEDATGRAVDLDLRGTADEAAALVSPQTTPTKPSRGRPRLGVTAREVTLLPRHWDWLAAQPGGASAALRRLVEDATRRSGAVDTTRRAKETAYRIMTTLAGNLPHYEEALRALFADDGDRLSELTADWPKDIVSYVVDILGGVRARTFEMSEATLVGRPHLSQGPG